MSNNTFRTDADGPYIPDFMIRGALKESARTLKEWGTGDNKLKQLQDKINRYAFIFPRKIRFQDPDSDAVIDKVGEPLERPLRAATAMGPSVTVVRSDTMPAGMLLKFELHLVRGSGLTANCIKDIIAYWQYIGIGQWRSAGYGRAELVSMDEIEDKSKPKTKAAKPESKAEPEDEPGETE